MKGRLAALLALLAFVPAGAVAQTELDDQEELDRRYYERYIEADEEENEEPNPRPAAPDREAETQAFLSLAEELVRDRNYRSAADDRYRVQSDDPRVDVKAVVALLERFRSYFDDFWRERIELRPYDKTSRTFLFYSFYKYNQLLSGNWRFVKNRPKGHYRPWFDALMVYTDPDGGVSLAETLMHEAAHQLVEQRIFPEDHPPALWVTEGLASYFGYTYLDGKGTFHAGVIGGKAVVLLRDGRKEGALDARDRLRDFKEQLKNWAGEGISPFSEAIAIRSAGAFYSESAPRHYTAAWVVVHYLLHGDDGSHADDFVRFLSMSARGQGGAELFYREIGLGRDELDEILLAYVKTLRVR